MNDVSHEQLLEHIQMLEQLNYLCLFDKVDRPILSQIVNKNLSFSFRHKLLKNTLEWFENVPIVASTYSAKDYYLLDSNEYYLQEPER
ncbi:hypothetical protein SAMN05444369_101327 [Capnocytophaga haemolytica]|jgi:hypothetical protein|uniref:Uncharacterized protein n=1 Tax=Capnocytophaga haemolytica TaxID=45243 RepID=A0AAX2GVP8_9FLAO|nr:hypothetical protein [Capnocytophaga haemolytica]SFN68693.1 hypothetical protein SAMN05444369_101327 [Capnocytophaga haemolytica]SNV05123.1 Uncharacterised protein [Capnocytophaga haemolytica]